MASTDPWPTEEELGAAYGTWYRPDSGRFGAVGDTLLRRSRALQARRIDAVAPPGAVLDVGAGDGALVDALRRRGREAIGLERAPAREDMRTETLEEMDGTWAAVIFWHSLEHLPSAAGALARAARLLAPGGVMVVAVPNASSLQARRFGARWLHLDLPLHLVHIPERALVARLEELGLRVQAVSHVRGGQIVVGWLHGLVGLLPRRPHLYRALRSSEARSSPLAARERVATVTAGVLLFPLAAALALVEIARRRGGTVYVEARLKP